MDNVHHISSRSIVNDVGELGEPQSNIAHEVKKADFDLKTRSAEENRKKFLFWFGLCFITLLLCFGLGAMFCYLRQMSIGKSKLDWHILLLVGEMFVVAVVALGIMAKAMVKEPPKESSDNKLTDEAIKSSIGAIIKQTIDNSLKP